MNYKILLLFFLFLSTSANVLFAEDWNIVKSRGNGAITIFYYNSDNFISDESGELKGIEYDILIEFKKYLKTKKIDLTIHFKKADSFFDLYEEIKHGASSEFGACSFSITEQRIKEVSFSPKYMPDVEVLINSDNVPIAKNEKEFIALFSKLTALNVPNTTFEEDIIKLKSFVPSFKIQQAQTASIIRERILSENNLFGYIELPTYLQLFQKGIRFKRQNLYKVERDGYGIILPKNSSWLEPISEFFTSKDFKRKVNEIIKNHLGNDVKDLMWNIDNSEKTIDQNEINLLTLERETQEMKIKQQTKQSQLLIGVVIVVLIIAFLLFYNYQIKKSANKLLTEKNLLIEEQKKEVEKQKKLVEEKHKEVLDSIRYAKRIQDALLTSQTYIERNINRLKKS